MALPSQLVYNDLDGEEIKHILSQRFEALLEQVSYLRRHITLPRVKMTLQVHLDSWADQPNPERQTIFDSVEIRSESDHMDDLAQPAFLTELADQLSAAPGGQPPDKIREDHGLPVPTPMRGTVAVEDYHESPEGKRVPMPAGGLVDRTGRAPERTNATVIVQDLGVAGLSRGQMNRAPIQRGTRDGQPVEPVRVHKE